MVMDIIMMMGGIEDMAKSKAIETSKKNDNKSSPDFTSKVIFDIETTGLDPEQDEILQFSAINQYGEVLLNTYVHPLRTESWDEAERINGISKEMVENAPGFDEIKKEVQEIFDGADELIAYNGSFDMAFLKNNGIEINNGIPYYDVMEEFAPYYGEWSDYYGEYKWQKLTTCANFWGFQFGAHDSLEDVKATLHAYERLHMPENDYYYVEQIRSVIPDSYLVYVMRDMNKIFQGKFQLKNLHEFIYDDSGRYRTNLLNQLNEKHAEIEEKIKCSDSYEEKYEYKSFNDMIDYVVKYLLTGLPEKKLYYVEIKETLSRIIPVKAFSQQEASEEIEGKYDRGEIVLDASDHIDTEFKTIDEANVTVTVKSKEQEGVKSKDDGREIE